MIDNVEIFENYYELDVDEKYLLSILVNKFGGNVPVSVLKEYSKWSINTFYYFINNLKEIGFLIEKKENYRIPQEKYSKLKEFTNFLTIDDINKMLQWCGKDELKEFCELNGLKKSGNKDELTSRILRSDVGIFHIINDLLDMDKLETLCVVANLEKKGTKQDLIDRIVLNLQGDDIIRILKEAKRPEKEIKSQKLKIFLSYSSKDLDEYHIVKIYNLFSKNPIIDKVYFWEIDRPAKASILTFMEKGINDSDVFIVFATKNSNQSPPVQLEIELAVYLNKIIISIFKNFEDIRLSLRTRLCMELDSSNLHNFYEKIINSLEM